MNFIQEHYLVWKTLHIISMVCWMAGLLYLPRLFVYHAQAKANTAESETFKTMERKLLKGITTPSMIATFLFGGLLILVPGVIEKPNAWFHIKMLLVLILAAYHGVCAKYVKVFALDQNERGHTFYRYFNEVPAVIMVVVIFLVVLKPF